MEQSKFLERIYPEFTADLNTSKVISGVSRYFKPFSDEITSSVDGTQLTLRGTIIGTSDIPQNIEDVTQLNVHASNSLLIDKNVELPSTNLVFASPFLNVMGPRSITLSGKGGASGIPGDSGGHFYAITDEVSNGNNLIIDVSGGNGGNGIDGLNGKNGENGYGGYINEVETRAATAHMEPVNYRSGSYGKPGKDAYKGSPGGQGGDKGSILFNNTNYKGIPGKYGVVTIIENGKKGNDGNNGVPGIGGLNGGETKEIYEGKWDKGTWNEGKKSWS